MTKEDNPDADPIAMLLAAGPAAIRVYEDAAISVGRLDAAARAAEPGLAELLVLRTAVAAFGGGRDRMIALLRTDSLEMAEHEPLRRFHAALRSVATRARGDAVPSLGALWALLGVAPTPGGSFPALDMVLRDPRGRTPPVLRAVTAGGALLRSDAFDLPERTKAMALAVSWVLCVGGAISDTWLTLPPIRGSSIDSRPDARERVEDGWMADALGAIAREARAAEEGLGSARHRVAVDEQRVRDAFGRAAYSALDVLGVLRAELAITIPGVARALDLTPPTAGAAVGRLTDLGIAREVTGRVRSRTFIYEGLVDALATPARPEP